MTTIPPSGTRPSTVAPTVGRGTAHSKVILLGEHAVVHRRPAIALPLRHPGVSAEARSTPGPLVLDTDRYTGPLDDAPADFAPVEAAIRGSLHHFGLPGTDVAVRVRSDIPIARGLGSSAAVAQAIVESVRDLAGGTLADEERFALVQAAERVAHGSPSGLDAHATRESTPILFENGAVTRLGVDFGGTFVIADTGVAGSTRAAVADVGSFVRGFPERAESLLDLLERHTRAAVADLAGDRRLALGERMTRAHDILAELGAGHESIDRLVAAAVAAGALGAKLTGGGQGGCIIALAESADGVPRLSASLEAAGAVAVWTVKPQGSRS